MTNPHLDASHNAATKPAETLDTLPADTPSASEVLYAGKYKSVEALEKGYRELSKHLHETRPQAPESYDFSFIEAHVDGANLQEDPLVTALAPVMQAHHITQQQAEALFATYLETVQAQLPDVTVEKEKLGPQADTILSQLDGFLQRYCNAPEHAMAAQLATTADGVRLLHKLARLSGEKPLPANAQATAHTADDLRSKAAQMLADPTLAQDPAKQRQYHALWEKIARLEG